MAELIAEHDWASTPLGRLETWPSALKIATSMILSSASPMALLVGDAAIALYNDAYAELIGLRHPGMLGANFRESWPELADLTDQALKAAERDERLSCCDLELTVLQKWGAEQVCVNIDLSPVRDENGVCLGLLNAMVDITEQIHAQRNAALQIDRLRNMFDQAPVFICLMGRDMVVEYENEANKRLLGGRSAVGRRFPEVHPEFFAAGAGERLRAAYANGDRYLARGEALPFPRPGGGYELRYADVVLEPLKDESGEVFGVFVAGFDVTSLVRAEKTVEATARRLSAAVAIARLGTFELDLKTREAKLDDRMREIFGFGPDERVTREDLISRIDPEDVARLAAEDSAAIAAGQTRREAHHRIRLPDGTIRHARVIGDLGVSRDGTPVWTIAVVEDVTERRRAEQRQLMLVGELNHRVKNTLATVQSIASQTLRSAPDLLQARDAFEARLMALSAAHDLLTAQSWRGARLDEVAARALAPFEAVQSPQVDRSGPPVWLTAVPALALSLALHELASNAAKYGALAVPEGRVSIVWSVCAGELVLAWTERGGPPAAPPSRSGFGMRLLQRSLAREMGGEVALTFARAGMRCEIRFPIGVREPEAESEAMAGSSSGREGFESRYWMPDWRNFTAE